MKKTHKTNKLPDEDRRFMISFVLLSVSYIVLGIVRLALKDPGSRLLCYLLAAFAIVAGSARIILFFTHGSHRRLHNNDLTFGITFIVAGVYILLMPENILDLLPVILGFCVIFDSILKLQYSFGLRRVPYRFWWVFMAVAIITAISGVLLVLGNFNEQALFYLLSIVLLVDGISNLLTLIFWRVIQNRQNMPTASHHNSPKKSPVGEEKNVIELPALAPPSVENTDVK